MSILLRIGMIAIGLALGGQTGAQTLYKCSVDGHISYGQIPCSGGTSVELKISAAPISSKEYGATLARQQKIADRFEKERHRREAKEERARERAERAAAGYRKRCATLLLRHRWALNDVATATARRAGKAKIRAQRAAEKLALACPQ